jgi:Putative Flp pilus-assembly TadE/G-like
VRARDERGQLTVLIIGFTAIVLLLLAVVTDASKAFLVRRDLAQLADGAALAGTRGVSGSVVVRGIELSQSAAEHEVALYLDSVERGGYDNLSWTVTVDGAEVAVHLQAVVDLPLVMPGTTGTATVSADGSALLSQG